MMKVLLYTFAVPHNLSFQIVNKLLGVDKYFVGDLQSLIDLTEKEYDFILGLGDYSSLAKKMRLEKTFINKYGKKPIDPLAPKMIESSWQFTGELIKEGEKATNGPCNRAAFLVAMKLGENASSTKATFLHIPHNGKLGIYKKALDEVLNALT